MSSRMLEVLMVETTGSYNGTTIAGDECIAELESVVAHIDGKPGDRPDRPVNRRVQLVVAELERRLTEAHLTIERFAAKERSP